jgi:hypothetical protein
MCRRQRLHAAYSSSVTTRTCVVPHALRLQLQCVAVRRLLPVVTGMALLVPAAATSSVSQMWAWLGKKPTVDMAYTESLHSWSDAGRRSEASQNVRPANSKTAKEHLYKQPMWLLRCHGQSLQQPQKPGYKNLQYQQPRNSNCKHPTCRSPRVRR